MKIQNAIKHTNLVIIKLESLISHVKDAETGVRGYVAVKDEQFLDVYDSSFSQLRLYLWSFAVC
jgi:CHASE3 domain sensor protein